MNEIQLVKANELLAEKKLIHSDLKRMYSIYIFDIRYQSEGYTCSIQGRRFMREAIIKSMEERIKELEDQLSEEYGIKYENDHTI